MESYQIFEECPIGFDTTLQAAACYCEYQHMVLLLKRPPGGRNGDTWSMPGGKLEQGESAIEAVVRELEEEVGLVIEEKDLIQLETFYVRIPQLDYVFYTFRKRFIEKPRLQLNLDEHVEARWVTFDEAMNLPLIRAGKELFMRYKKYVLELE